MWVDSSPYFAVHQVVPGHDVQETVQGELVSEQLKKKQKQDPSGVVNTCEADERVKQ